VYDDLVYFIDLNCDSTGTAVFRVVVLFGKAGENGKILHANSDLYGSGRNPIGDLVGN